MNTAATYRKMACPFCSVKIEYDAQDDGKLTLCPHCKQDIELTMAPLVMNELPGTIRIERSDVIGDATKPLRKSWRPPQWAIPIAFIVAGLVVGGATIWFISLYPDIFAPIAQGGMSLAAIFVVGAIYFLPAIVAHRRQHRNFTGVLLLNLFLGWTLLGWVGALIWSVYEDKK